MVEYPRHMHHKKQGGQPRVVQNDKERDQALKDGFTLEPTQPTSPGVDPEAASRETPPSDPNVVARVGAARADHEAKQNAEAEAKRRSDDELRADDRQNALNKK